MIWHRIPQSAATVMLAVVATLVLAGTATSQQFDSNSLPEPVQEMRNAILDAAESGDIGEMRVPIELNEIAPVIEGAGPASGDAVEALRTLAPDTGGRAILAAMLDILAMPAATVRDDIRMFVWPYLAVRDLQKLSAKEQVDLLRLVPEADAIAMTQTGAYTHYRLEIGADGTWHFFGRGE